MKPRRRRLVHAINRLALARLVRATGRLSAKCALCTCDITQGTEYRNAGTLKAHEICFQALAQQAKTWR